MPDKTRPNAAPGNANLPGNAILPIGTLNNANLESGDPGGEP